jgi:hypothetical protein
MPVVSNGRARKFADRKAKKIVGEGRKLAGKTGREIGGQSVVIVEEKVEVKK